MGDFFGTIITNIFKLYAAIDNRMNIFCECEEYRETPLCKALNESDFKTKYRLIECLANYANLYANYYSKLPSIEAFRYLRVIFEMLELKNMPIFVPLKTKKVAEIPEFVSEIKNLSPLEILDENDDKMVNIYSKYADKIDISGIEYAKTLYKYFKDDRNNKIMQLVKILDGDRLFIIYFVLSLLGPCYKIPFRKLAYKPHKDLVAPLICYSLIGLGTKPNDSVVEQFQRWSFSVFKVHEREFKNVKEVVDYYDGYMKIFMSKTEEEYQLAKAKYYSN